ncbi:transposase [bacterium]|nr:transposase [bacterium]
MPRSKRFFIPGYTWHITHRCHNNQFLLKYNHDKTRWMDLLHRAKKRFQLSIFNYTVTSNHIHLLVVDTGYNKPMAKAIHLVAGRTAWEYNQRKNRKGAYWEDRYHATAIETEKHLLDCMVYIDLNMVRAGVVNHPAEWKFCGYQEISGLKKRNLLIDKNGLFYYLGLQDPRNLEPFYKAIINEKILQRNLNRESRWTEAIAVGSQEFTERIKEELGIKARYRAIGSHQNIYQLKEDKSVFWTPKISN